MNEVPIITLHAPRTITCETYEKCIFCFDSLLFFFLRLVFAAPVSQNVSNRTNSIKRDGESPDELFAFNSEYSECACRFLNVNVKVKIIFLPLV